MRTDQTGRMLRLIWVFAGCTGHFIGFFMKRLNLWFFRCCIIKLLSSWTRSMASCLNLSLVPYVKALARQSECTLEFSVFAYVISTQPSHICQFIWAATWQNQQNNCAPSKDSDQPDQSLRCPHEESLGPKLPIECTGKTLIRLGGCPGWSESSLGRQSLCWFCHVVARVMYIVKENNKKIIMWQKY